MAYRDSPRPGDLTIDDVCDSSKARVICVARAEPTGRRISAVMALRDKQANSRVHVGVRAEAAPGQRSVLENSAPCKPGYPVFLAASTVSAE